jgi:hypothetical protein
VLRKLDAERAFEAGIVILGLGLLGGLAALLFGRASGDIRRGRRHAEAPPTAGAVANERHQHISAVSAR